MANLGSAIKIQAQFRNVTQTKLFWLGPKSRHVPKRHRETLRGPQANIFRYHGGVFMPGTNVEGHPCPWRSLKTGISPSSAFAKHVTESVMCRTLTRSRAKPAP